MPMRATVLPQPEPGHAILRVSELDAPADGLALSLQRQQGPDSHLADDGWRRTEAWLVPAFVQRVKGALEFHLGPEICDRLAGTSTVRLRIKEPDIGVVGATVVAWPQMLTSGAVDPSARSHNDTVILRRPALRIEPPPLRIEPELPPPLVLAAPELPPRLPDPEPAPPRSNTGTWLITMVVLAILIAGGVYAYLFHRQQLESLIAAAPNSATTTPAEPPSATPAPETAATPPPSPVPSPVPTPAREPPKKSARMAVEEYLATKPKEDELLARARQYAQGGDLTEAFLVWRAAAEAGNAQAELEVAAFYDPTLPPKKGFSPDGSRAADWYERAALAGNVEAQRRYGMLLAKGGAGLPADTAKARTWLQQAAAQKDAEAKTALDTLKP
jgi:hypothetical protein